MNPNFLRRASLALIAAVILVGGAVTAGAQTLSRSEPIAEVTPADVRADAGPSTTDTTLPDSAPEATDPAEVAAAQAAAEEEARVLDYFHKLEEEAAYLKAAQEQAYFADLEQQAAAVAAAAARPAGVPDD